MELVRSNPSRRFANNGAIDDACAERLSRWIRDEFGRALPFRCMVVLHGLTHSGGATPTHLLQIDFPLAHLQQIRNKAGALDSPLARKWMRERQAFVFDPKLHGHWPDIDPAWLRSFQSHGLTNAVISGFVDEADCTASYFSVHGVPPPTLAHAARTLQVWSEVLHDRLRRCVEQAAPPHIPSEPCWSLLSPREMAIAKAAAQGKSNLAIAKELDVCESTVKTHMNSVFCKLGIRSRSELCVAFNDWPPEGLRGIRVLT